MSGRKITSGELKEAMERCVDVISYYGQWLRDTRISLRQEMANGWSNRTLCPIHGDQGTPNFFVNFVTKGFHCHACGKGGSFIDFWMYMNNMDPARNDKREFATALKEVSKIIGFDIDGYVNSGGDPEVASRIAKQRQEKQEKLSTGNPWEPRQNRADENDKITAPVKKEVVDAFHKALDPDHYLFLSKMRGLTKKTIEEYQIGWDKSAKVKDAETGIWYDGRIAIPVFDKNGECRNFRLYSNKCDSQFKMINYVVDKRLPTEKSYGKPVRLFNLHRLVSDPKIEHVVIVGGEFDCILLNQMLKTAGYDTWLAVTGTHGENTFEHEWIIPMYGKSVYFCLDCDEPGKMAALEHVNSYFLKPLEHGKFPSVKILELPLPGTKESKDITDFFVKSNFPVENFIDLALNTPPLHAGGLDNDEGCVDVIDVDSFVEAIKSRQYIDKRIRVPITISASVDKTYHAIRRYKVSYCPFAEEGNCCMGDGDNKQDRTIPYGHPILIEACMEKEHNILRSIGRMVCQKGGDKIRIHPLVKVVMEKYYAHQVVKRWRAEEDENGRLHNTQELTQAPVFVLQPPERVNVEPQNYLATGWVRTDPKTCSAVFFVEKLVGMDDDWKKFSMENRESRELIEYIAKEFTTDQFIEEIVQGVTRIYESDEILYAVLLTYLSPIKFIFNGGFLRGWVNAAIIGDSGTGKSQTYIRFSDWIELGDLFSALSGSRTGLLYAVKQRGGEWMVSTGRYVQANDKIIAVDEAQEIAKSEIKQMANAMDLGYLKVERVASGGYQTRTRTLFLMNPKDFKGEAATVSDFTNGCEALAMNMDPMFIRRLDMAVFVTGGQKHEFYNRRAKLSTGNVEMRLTAKMVRSLIYWAWTRKSNQIIWTEEATDMCLKTATAMSNDFGDADKVPLVNPMDFRENLARLSTAFAILSRSFVNNFECVEVKPTHVQRVAILLEKIYSSPACNLRQYSKHIKSRVSIDDYRDIQEMVDSVISQEKVSNNQYVRECMPFVQLLCLIQQIGTVRQQDLSDQLRMEKNWVQKRLSILQSLHLLDMTRYGYRGTRRFNLFMRKWQSSPEVDKMIHDAQASIGKFALNIDTTRSVSDYSSNNQPQDDPF